MAALTDYLVLGDPQVVIGTAGDDSTEFDFSLPATLSREDPGILAWFVDGEDDTDGRSLDILWLNNTTNQVTKVTRTAAVSGSRYNTMHEVVDREILSPGKHKLTFEVVFGSGPVKISDVVLWFKRTG